jgi:DNA-binding FrmR family transcriptional regulator
MGTKTVSTTAPDHAMGIAEPVREDLLRRLARIRGQVEGIGRMVEDERYCPDIMQQFAAVHSAMRSAEKQLLANHLEHCATHAIEQGGQPAARVRDEIVDLFYRYVR